MGRATARAWRRARSFLLQLAVPVLYLSTAAADDLGVSSSDGEQYWAYLDSAAALHARGMDDVALQEIDEALRLRPGDAEAAALRVSILAALHPPAAAAAPAAASRATESLSAGPDAMAEPPVPAASVVDARGRSISLQLPLPVLLVSSPALDQWSAALDRLADGELLRAEALLWRGLLKDPRNVALRRAVHLLAFVRGLGGGPAPAAAVQIDLNQAALALADAEGERFEANLQGWQELALAYLRGRPFGAVGRLNERQKVGTEAALLFGAVLGQACMRQAERALVDGRIDDALLALQAAAALAPRADDLRRWIALLDGHPD